MAKESNKRSEVTSGGFLTNPIYIQITYPLLRWLKRQRGTVANSTDRMGVNGGIILYSAIFLEGFLEDILCALVPHYADDDGTKSTTLAGIEKTTGLRKYKDLFKDFDLQIDNFLNDEEQEDLDFIFRYRNLLAHGQRDSYIIYHGDDFVPRGIDGSVYADIWHFLIKRGVLKETGSVQPDHSGLFSDEVADWMFARVRAIVATMFETLNVQLPHFQALQRANMMRITQMMRIVQKLEEGES